MGALAPGSVGDSAASSPPGVGVVGSSQSQESLVLTAPSSVASSAPSAERNRRSRSRVAGGSTKVRSCCRSSLSHGGESRGERRCARSRSGGSRARSRKLRSRSTTRSQTHGRGALDGIRHALPLPMCGPGRGLQTATGLAEFACALGVAVRGLDECVRALLAVARPGVTVCGHTGPVTGHVTVASHGIGPFSPLTVRGRGRGAGVQGGVPWIAWSCFCLPGSQQLWVESGACPCSGGRLHPSAHDFFAGPRQVVPQPVGALCSAGCSWGGFVFGCGCHRCRGVAWSCCSGDVISPLACASASVPALGVVSSAGAASATGLSGRRERAWVSLHFERRRRRSSSGGRSHSCKTRGKGWSPSPAHSSRSARASISSSAASSDAGEQDSVMPPPPAGHPGVGGSRFGVTALLILGLRV